ncbi:MAG: DUF111 family protein, partial [Clostridia bacterium]|nr:DUF111 family protein [Clostridia bacterium]
MKTLYLECGMGAAGDMLTAALLELLPDRQSVVDRLNVLGLPGVHYEMEPASKCGVCGTHMKVTVNGEEEESMDDHGHHPEGEHMHAHDGHDHEHHYGEEHEHAHHHGHDHEEEHEHDHHGYDHEEEHEHDHHGYDHEEEHGHHH